MIEHPSVELLGRYCSRGIVVDTNILLLLFVGGFERQLVPRFKRTSQFTTADYDLLARLLPHFQRVVTTANVLTEVNSFVGQLYDPARSSVLSLLAASLASVEERLYQSCELAKDPQFTWLGLTDCSILEAAGDDCVVLTDDLKLYIALEHRGLPVVNFNHLRLLGGSFS